MKQLLTFSFAISIQLLLCFAADAQNQTSPNDSIHHEFSGTIISKTGNIVKIQQTENGSLPAADTKGTLSKYFEKFIFGAKTTGWLEVGNMKIKTVENNIITMVLLEEKSIITINGQKEDHFKPGFLVKFGWNEKAQ